MLALKLSEALTTSHQSIQVDLELEIFYVGNLTKSILGPPLFILINNLLDKTNSPTVTYVGDVKMWRSTRNEKDPFEFQIDLSTMSKWTVGTCLNLVCQNIVL